MTAAGAVRSALSLLSRGAVVVAALASAACVGTPRVDTVVVPAVELADVPFFPQTEYQCGPAALATILAHEGLAVDAETLAPDVYVAALRGSLQAELLGATRRHGFVPSVIAADPAALFAEVRAGKPVLVLQNLGLERWPVWHYAVVVGFDPERRRVLLRSGEERRREEPLRRFLRSWQRADYWGFVAARPDEPPVTASAATWIRAATDAARVLPPAAAEAAVQAARSRWPAEPLVLYASAVQAGAAGRWQDAAADYLALLAIEPGNAPARNNLANMLAEGGCIEAARREAQAALSAVRPESPLRAAIEDTFETVTAAAPALVEPPHCADYSSSRPQHKRTREPPHTTGSASDARLQ